MSDSKKISRQLAEKYGGITDITETPKPAPVPTTTRKTSLWDDDSSYRSPDRPRYVRDRWAKKPSTYEPSRPLEPRPSWAQFDDDDEPRPAPLPTVPLGRARADRPPYTDGDVDWELAQTIVIDRRVTWTHFIHMVGLEYPLYPQHDVEIFEKLRNIFLTRKGQLFTQ